MVIDADERDNPEILTDFGEDDQDKQKTIYEIILQATETQVIKTLRAGEIHGS